MTEKSSTDPDEETGVQSHRVIRYVASTNFAPALSELGISLLVSTYHAGKVVMLGTDQGEFVCEFHNFETAMGLALHPQQLAVGTRRDIWFLHSLDQGAGMIEPQGRYTAGLVTRKAFHTGNIHAHEMAFVGDELWIANTLFSCLCTLDERYNFVPRWKPPFISGIGAPLDRCHLNGLAVDESVEKPHVRYVTCLGTTDTGGGWREDKLHGGVILDVKTGEVVSRDLAMPHSPRVYDGRLLVLDSGRGELQSVDTATGQRTTIESFPGYARGLAFHGPFAFVALSEIRESSVFGGLPISASSEPLKCGIGIVDLRSGQTAATLEFTEGVQELFDIKVIPQPCLAIRGPHVNQDQRDPIWVVPPLK